MSSVITSYFEIVRLDGEHITPEEQDWLFQGLVRAYEGFGSYWVRIYREYDPQTRRMWIQYGSGKHQGEYNDFIENDRFLDLYALWHRSANDWGSSGSLFFTSGLSLEGVPHKQWEDARYGFDSVLLAGKLLHLSDKTRPIGNQGRHLLPLGGSFTTLTKRAFLALVPPYDGPCLGYDPLYQPGRYVPLYTEKGPHALIWTEELTGLPEGEELFFQREPNLNFVAWCWRGKVVQVNFGQERPFVHRMYLGDDPKRFDPWPSHFSGLTADGWANLVNPSYLTFRAWHAEQVRWAGGPDVRPGSA